MFLAPFILNPVQNRPLDPFKYIFYHKLQISVLLSNLKHEFENIALERARI